jgi:hypothetical protein
MTQGSIRVIIPLLLIMRKGIDGLNAGIAISLAIWI